MPRFAANLSTMFGEHAFLDRFRAAANCGFRGVEFQFPYEWPAGAIAERLAGNGLEQVLLNAPPGDIAAGERGLAALPGRSADFRASIEQALDYAGQLPCSRLHVMAARADVEADRAAMTAVYVENLRWAAERAAADGVRILIEPINDRDAPGYFLNCMSEAAEILAAVDHDNLAIQCDLYHLQIMNGDLANTVTQALPQIAHFQIAGAPGRHEPDNGEINYPFLFNLLDSLGYDGWVGCEYVPAGATRDGLGWAFDYGIGGHGGG